MGHVAVNDVRLYDKHIVMMRKVLAGKCSYVLNDENWGLGNIELPEYIL